MVNWNTRYRKITICEIKCLDQNANGSSRLIIYALSTESLAQFYTQPTLTNIFTKRITNSVVCQAVSCHKFIVTSQQICTRNVFILARARFYLILQKPRRLAEELCCVRNVHLIFSLQLFLEAFFAPVNMQRVNGLGVNRNASRYMLLMQKEGLYPI